MLLKNEACPECDKTLGLLPLSPSQTVAVIGPTADRPEALVSNYNGCTNWSNPEVLNPHCTFVTPLQGIRDLMKTKTKKKNVLYAEGSKVGGDDNSGFSEAVVTAGKADVVVMFVGLATCSLKSKADFCLEAMRV